MKKLLLISLLALVGCEPTKEFPTSEGSIAVMSHDYMTETCYKGIVYVKFGAGTGTWGSVMIGKDLKPVSC